MRMKAVAFCEVATEMKYQKKKMRETTLYCFGKPESKANNGNSMIPIFSRIMASLQ